MKLVSMIDFVLDWTPKEVGFLTDEEWADSVHEYATFLNQPLNLGMFVPAIEVDGKWEVLEMPTPNISDSGNWNFQARENQYQQAKDRVLFEGFESDGFMVESELIGLKYASILGGGYKIFDLLDYGKPTLTAKGQELSGLK